MFNSILGFQHGDGKKNQRKKRYAFCSYPWV